MAIPTIVWIIVIAVAGVAVIAFIDEIKAWAKYILSKFVKNLDKVLGEIVGKVTVKIIRKGERYVKRLYAKIFGRRNMKKNRTRVWEEDIADVDLPEQIIDELDENPELTLVESNSVY